MTAPHPDVAVGAPLRQPDLEHVLGERVWFHTVDEDPAVTEFDIQLDVGGTPPPPHLHLHQTEFFEVLAGRVHLWIDGTTSTLAPGERAQVPAGVPHAWGSEDGQAILVRARIEPSLGFRTMLGDLFGLVNSGALTAEGPRHDAAHRIAQVLDLYADRYRLVG